MTARTPGPWSNRAGRLILAQHRADTIHDADYTIRARAAGEQAHAEMLARFGPLTADNAAEAIRWQEKRIAKLIGGSNE